MCITVYILLYLYYCMYITVFILMYLCDWSSSELDKIINLFFYNVFLTLQFQKFPLQKIHFNSLPIKLRVQLRIVVINF